jgi:hypothetical protein
VAKGFRPTDDPDWHHDHVLTSEIRMCARPGCRATFPIYCHNGRKRFCNVCARAVRRDHDRISKRQIRAQAKHNQDAEEAAVAVRLARAGMNIAEVQEALRELRSNRRLSADRLYQGYRDGDGIKGDQAHATVPSMQQAGSPDAGARPPAALPRGHLQESRQEAASEPVGQTRSCSREGSEGVAVRGDPDRYLPNIPPTDLPCCREGACPQHRQVAGMRHWYKPSRRGDFHDVSAA